METTIPITARAAYNVLPGHHQRTVRSAINVAFGIKGRMGAYREMDKDIKALGKFKSERIAHAFAEVGVTDPFRPHPITIPSHANRDAKPPNGATV